MPTIPFGDAAPSEQTRPLVGINTARLDPFLQFQ